MLTKNKSEFLYNQAGKNITYSRVVTVVNNIHMSI